jgi:hypothetical protein
VKQQFVFYCDLMKCVFPAKMLKAGRRGALHVSRNQEIKYLGEDDHEGLIMTIREYKTLAVKGAESMELVTWMNKLGSVSNLMVGQVMNHKETLCYLLCLHVFNLLFGYEVVFSGRWVKKMLHDVSGRVSDLILPQ